MLRKLLTASAIALLIGCATVQGQKNTMPLVATQPAAPKMAFLGVATSPVPEVLGAQLDLPKGFGLVIDAVVPGSAADEAGLKRYDILQKLNDQIIVNQEQLMTLIGSYKPGDTIQVTVIHQAKPTVLSVKLGEKPVAQTHRPHQEHPGPMMQGPGRFDHSRPFGGRGQGFGQFMRPGMGRNGRPGWGGNDGHRGPFHGGPMDGWDGGRQGRFGPSSDFGRQGEHGFWAFPWHHQPNDGHARGGMFPGGGPLPSGNPGMPPHGEHASATRPFTPEAK